MCVEDCPDTGMDIYKMDSIKNITGLTDYVTVTGANTAITPIINSNHFIK